MIQSIYYDLLLQICTFAAQVISKGANELQQLFHTVVYAEV